MSLRSLMGRSLSSCFIKSYSGRILTLPHYVIVKCTNTWALCLIQRYGRCTRYSTYCSRSNVHSILEPWLDQHMILSPDFIDSHDLSWYVIIGIVSLWTIASDALGMQVALLSSHLSPDGHITEDWIKHRVPRPSCGFLNHLLWPADI